MPDLFRTCRISAFEKWQTGTSRSGCDVDECYDESYECCWQEHAQDQLGFTHISIFCSLADWSCNISDLLSDTRYDNHDFDDIRYHDVLARYYTRLMMIIAEHLADLQKIAEKMGTQNARAARRRISPPSDANWVHNLHSFVNRVCKHKAEGQNIHHCNHHLPFCFGDMNDPCPFNNPIRLPTVNLENADAIQYPKLADLVDGVLTAYAQVDELLMSNTSAFRKLCEKYDDPNFNVT